MKTLELKSFSDFEVWVEDLKKEQTEARLNSRKHYSTLLFRGQGDESWKLSTTLERYSDSVKSLGQYLKSADRIKLQVELHTGKKWDPILRDGFVIDDDDREFHAHLPSLEYLVYLRHHGFPSPLLDWTRSPYIAALFAFSECPNNADGKIAIYVYQEYAGTAKTYSNDRPFIQSIGRYIDTHKRHSIQQAQYTICLTQQKQFNSFNYTIHPHDEYRNLENQDHIYKITLPKNEKLKMLAKLDQFNLNFYSLYGDETSLMSTLAINEFYLRPFV
jgi:hypothetical protein